MSISDEYFKVPESEFPRIRDEFNKAIGDCESGQWKEVLVRLDLPGRGIREQRLMCFMLGTAMENNTIVERIIHMHDAPKEE